MTLSKPARNLLLFKNRPVKRNVLNLAADNLLLFKTHPVVLLRPTPYDVISLI